MSVITTPYETPADLMRALGMEPRPWQEKVLASEDKEIAYGCGRGGGKTTVALVLALHQALAKPESVVIVAAPTVAMACWMLDDAFRLATTAATAEKFRRVLLLRFESRSRIFFFDDNPRRLLSLEPDLIVIDEAQRFSSQFFDEARCRLVRKEGRLVRFSWGGSAFSGTPTPLPPRESPRDLPFSC